MTKAEGLQELTKLYDICINSSSEPDDSWFRIAGAISTAEDVVIQEDMKLVSKMRDDARAKCQAAHSEEVAT